MKDYDLSYRVASVCMLLFIVLIVIASVVGLIDLNEKDTAVIESAEPVKTVEIQGENVRLADVQGYRIIEFPVARKTYQETLYVLRLYGVAHEFAYSDRGEAEDMGIYICMLKGDGL